MTNLSNWNANTIRFTAFPESDFQIDRDWWEQVVGEEPETEISQAKTGILQFEGNFGKGKLVLAIQKNPPLPRIDWVYTPSDVSEPNLQIPSVGELTSELAVFEEYMLKWLNLSNLSFKRIALGLILHQSVSDKLSGYELLESQYLGIKPHFGANTSDFMYQINRMRSSKKIETLQINRLMKWSIGRFQSVVVSPIQQVPQESFVMLLELDINSSPEYESSLMGARAVSLLQEFVGIAHEIAEKGESD